jgi:hypothetical protein
MAWRNLWSLSAPFLVFVVVGLFAKESRRAAVFTLLPTLSFVGLWVLISDETNYVMRFRYPVLPMVLLGSVAVTMALRPASSLLTRPAAAWVLSLAVAGSLAAYQHSRFRSVATKRMGLYDAALVLREVGRRDYTLATTEAGLLPLYSSWRAVDAWGLNDAWIAHNGGITEEYLERYRPEVILFHAYFSPETPDTGPKVEARSLGLPWYRMVMTLKRYAEKNDYALAAVYGRNASAHVVVVRVPGVAAVNRGEDIAVLLGVALQDHHHSIPGGTERALLDAGTALRRLGREVRVEHDHLGPVAVEVVLGDLALVGDPGVVQAPGIHRAPGRVQG